MKKKTPRTGLFIKKGSSQKWYWHLRGRNGKIIASGHGFNSKRGAKKSIVAVMKFFRGHFEHEIIKQFYR